MKTKHIKVERKAYSKPAIESVILDNEISLVLASDPPAGPGEVINKTPDYFNNDPYKNNVV